MLDLYSGFGGVMVGFFVPCGYAISRGAVQAGKLQVFARKARHRKKIFFVKGLAY